VKKKRRGEDWQQPHLHEEREEPEELEAALGHVVL
jgi:hypothetical protein